VGQWERSLTQLQVAGELDAKALSMVQTYREALRCEALRAEVFAGKRTPLVLGKPTEWMALLLQALSVAGAGNEAEAQALRDRAFEAAPTTAGRIDDQPFAWIADADPRIGPMLEAIVNGRYYWIPFSRLREIRLEKPVDLRDLIWTPAQLVYANGGDTVALLPARYPGSEAAQDARLVMGRATEWQERTAGLPVGIGQKMLATDQGEYGILDARKIQLEGIDDGDGAPAAAGDGEDGSATNGSAG
jgi:type VI secretion system protein ImpE